MQHVPKRNRLCFYTVHLLPWWFFEVATAAYNVFGTRDNLCFLISSRCKTHKGYPFNAEYWRWFPAFLLASQICFCCCLWVVYVTFSLHQTPLHTPIFCLLFSPQGCSICTQRLCAVFFFGRRKCWNGSEEHTVWTSRFSLPNSKSGISKQKALSKFEQAVTFILEYCDLELVTVVWKDQDIGRYYTMRSAFFFWLLWTWFCFFVTLHTFFSPLIGSISWFLGGFYMGSSLKSV